MSKTFKLGFFGRFVIMYFVAVLTLCAFSPLLQVTKFEAASADVADTEKARAVTGHVDYSVDSTFPSNILGVSAVYYDYLSDQERDTGGKWLHPQKSGTGHNGSDDDWYPFYSYNEKISSYAKSNSSWATPLYFGNFCNNSDAYPNGNDHDSGGWANVTGERFGYKFNYPANNSNALSNYKVSYQGLVNDTLVNNNLYVNDTVQAPYFNNDWLNQNNLAKIIEGEFPFTIEEENGYKKYSFNSKNAEDNVYFTWAGGTSGTYPTKVNYGAGSSFGVEDGIKYFMYNEASGKGIFPFNNASDTNKGNKDSNENLNYGFGIRMDIDFRVPNGGVIPGTNTPIKFDFTGDDDLWVYITDKDTGKSELVLDMGGAHKESHGCINFSTKTATVDAVHTGGENDPHFVYLSKENVGWDSRNTYAYFWNDNGTVGKEWPGYNMQSYTDGGTNLRTGIPVGAKYVKFCNYYDGNTYNESDTKTLSTSNGAFWMDGNTAKDWDSKPDDAGLDPTPATASSKTKSFTFDNTNDQKTYTMTVFYMERGLIESNMSISFTMTPLTNDLEVTKTLNTASVNSGLVDELKNNEEFTYTIQNAPDTNTYPDNYELATNKAYTHTTNSSTTGDDGKFYLKDEQKAQFDSQFKVGTGIKVVENDTSKSKLSYSTSYTLTDKISGTMITSANSTTSKFDFLNSQRNTDDKTSLKLAYTNTPKVAPLTVRKEVVNESGQTISANSDAEFTYNIALDLYEGDTYNENLALAYTKYNADGTEVDSDTTTNGKFTLKGGQYVTFEGIPLGTKYRITEQVYDGYIMSKYTVNDTVYSSITNNTIEKDFTATTVVEITNTYKPFSATLVAKKTLDGVSYNGTEFTFKATALDTPGVEIVQSNVTNGTVTFSGLSFDEVGTYRYKIEEVKGNSADYIYDDTVYYAQIVVTSSNGVLSKSSLTYYSDANFSKQISAGNVLFENESANCEVRIAKKNYNGTQVLQDAEFMIVAAKDDGNGNFVVDNASDFAPKRATVAKYDNTYYAKFTDIPQGDYIVIETRAPKGYELSTEQKHIKVERTSENGGVIEDFIQDTTTTLLPKAGGTGDARILLVGVLFLSAGVLLLKYYDSKKKKAYCKNKR